MAGISRVGDTNQVGGQLLRGAETVFVNGKPVALHVSDITSHANHKGPHKSSRTTSGSPSVFCEGAALVRVGSTTTCGHLIIVGSEDVNCP